jgi:hypothetical protein
MTAQQSASQNCFKETATQVQSRFAPVSYLQLCGPGYQPNPYPDWAWCLAIICEKKSDTLASCACTARPAGSPQYPYVVVRTSHNYDAQLCTAPGAPFSSATQNDAFGIQKFLGAPPPVVANPPGK